MPNNLSSKNGAIELKIDSKSDTVWASQKDLSVIFDIERSVITKHIKKIFQDDEVNKNPTVAFFAQVQKEGSREVKRDIEFYTLDIILAVGYRTNSAKAIKFRRWAAKSISPKATPLTQSALSIIIKPLCRRWIMLNY